MNHKGVKIRIKNLTKVQFEEIGVFIDMDKMVGKEYITIGGDDNYVNIQTRYRVTLPIQAVEIIGKVNIVNCSKFKNASEESVEKMQQQSHKRNKFKKRF